MPRTSRHSTGRKPDRYDVFRERLLKGRQELIDRLGSRCGERIVEFGGGTGRNQLFLGESLHTLERVDLVDLCPALLDMARERFSGNKNVHLVEADAVTWQPEAPVDRTYFSYSLSMIPY